MPRENELTQAAHLIIRRRGTSAAVRAAQRAMILLNAGETASGEIWQRIANEITRIRAEEREAYAASLALYGHQSEQDKRFVSFM